MAFPVCYRTHLADLGRRMGERVTPPRRALTGGAKEGSYRFPPHSLTRLGLRRAG